MAGCAFANASVTGMNVGIRNKNRSVGKERFEDNLRVYQGVI
jgi:hypothetical protein